MDKIQKKIDFLTKLKMSFGIDTRSDAIEMDLKDLRKKQEKVQTDIETSRNKLSIIDLCITDINKIYELSEEDIQNGDAIKYSTELTSYELSIARSKAAYKSASVTSALNVIIGVVIVTSTFWPVL